MQSNFQFSAEDAGLVTPVTAVDEAYLNGWYAGMNFASALRSSPFIGGVSPCHPFSPVENTSVVPYGHFYCFSPEVESLDMKVPKQEALNYTGVFDLQKFSTTAGDEELYSNDGVNLINFFSTSTNSGQYEADDFGGRFSPLLPLLESFEQHHLSGSLPQATTFSPFKVRFTEPSSSSAKPEVSLVHNTRSLSKRPTPYRKPSASAKQSGRRRLSERTRYLHKLLPGDKKMDTATMLEEAYKYLKFLQAQVIALQSMPPHAAALNDVNIPNNGDSEVVHGMLGKLNRQQLLQVVVNSPMAQAVLYSRGRCIYSVEQLDILKEMAEKKVFLEQITLPSFPQ